MVPDADRFQQRVVALGPNLVRALVLAGVPEPDAKDAVQDTLLDLLARESRLAKLHPDELRAYARRAAFSFASKLFRATRRRARREAAWGAIEWNPRPDAVRIVHCRRFVDELETLLATLPAQIVPPYVLCEVRAMTCEQAGAQLRIPVGTVKTRLRKAQSLIRESQIARRL